MKKIKNKTIKTVIAGVLGAVVLLAVLFIIDVTIFKWSDQHYNTAIRGCYMGQMDNDNHEFSPECEKLQDCQHYGVWVPGLNIRWSIITKDCHYLANEEMYSSESIE